MTRTRRARWSTATPARSGHRTRAPTRPEVCPSSSLKRTAGIVPPAGPAERPAMSPDSKGPVGLLLRILAFQLDKELFGPDLLELRGPLALRDKAEDELVVAVKLVDAFRRRALGVVGAFVDVEVDRLARLGRLVELYRHLVLAVRCFDRDLFVLERVDHVAAALRRGRPLSLKLLQIRGRLGVLCVFCENRYRGNHKSERGEQAGSLPSHSHPLIERVTPRRRAGRTSNSAAGCS